MSFDSRVKSEILKQRYPKKQELLAFLSGVCHTCGEITLSSAGLGLEFSSGEFDVIHRVKIGFSHIFPDFEETLDPLTFENEDGFVLRFVGRNVPEMLEVMQATQNGMINTGLPNFGSEKHAPQMKSAYVAGCFVGAGKLSVPKRGKAGYGVEFSFAYEDTAEEFSGLLQEFGIVLSKITRKQRTLLLARTADAVSDVINLMGAEECFWAFQDIVVGRSKAGKDNRVVNCDVANEDRTAIASVKQVLAIERIKAERRFDFLDENLKEIANLRLQHQNVSLEELGKMLNPPISKSGANHRMRKIVKISEE